MKNIISAKLLDSFKKQAYSIATLVEIGNDIKITDWSSIVSYDNSIYYPKGMNAGNVKSGTSAVIDRFSMAIDDTNQEVFVKISQVEDQKKIEFKIFIGLIPMSGDKKIDVSSVSRIYYGFVDSWEYKDRTVSISVVSMMYYWTQLTMNTYSSSCRWREFKGEQCKYSGEETFCNRSYSQCELYENTSNFGGFRWLPGSSGSLRTAEVVTDPPLIDRWGI